MALFKCKMCGGDLEVVSGATVAECEYCGTKQTVPSAMDENLQNLFNRANTLRIKSEFDKAEKLYEKVIQSDSTQAEAYWGLILCKYGIEYVDDPATFKKIPTCHRASYDSVIADDDYKAALEHADISQRALYEEQAKEIDRIQKEILALAQKEEAYDVFICYKETDPDGRRTQDSVIANDIYYQLTQEGFKVFYAAITLEGKLGSAYEPIIFAALNSAKVMLSIGTKPEYFNAVWVKNEWSRFLKIIKNDRTKMLIPCYRDMDAYELPEEFAHLQAQDMGKIGFINDVVRGIKKVIVKDEPKATVIKETVVNAVSASTAPLLKRAFMFLEDGDWNAANEYCEKVLDLDPEDAQAYLGKLMAELNVRKQENLKDQAEPFDDRNNFQKAVRFADEKLKAELTGYIEYINTRNENARLEEIYSCAISIMSEDQTEDGYKKAAQLFKSIREYQDSAALFNECLVKAEEARLSFIYTRAKKMMVSATTESAYKEAARLFESISEYQDSVALAEECLVKAKECLVKAEEQAEIDRKDRIYAAGRNRMSNRVERVEDFAAAIREFEKIPGWKDADEQIAACQNKIEKIKAKEEAARQEYERKLELARIEAEKRAKRNKKIAIITTPIVCAIIAFIIVLNAVIIPAQKKSDFIATYGQEVYDKFGLVEKGAYITFGEYEQDNNTSNGKEDVKWLVLEIKDGKALVISKYPLDCKPYNTSYTDVTWETCTLRKWLNNDFINAAFSADEKAMIPTVTVSADKNPNYSTNPGNATQDQVFLLSITEANKYFSSDSTRRCKPTDYAVANGAYLNSTCGWWLRSPGDDQRDAALVYNFGGVSEHGSRVDNDDTAVRPALWIDLSKLS